MAKHAMRTALTLYEGGTLDLETAARRAGVAPVTLERHARACHVPTPETTVERDERVRVAGD